MIQYHKAVWVHTFYSKEKCESSQDFKEILTSHGAGGPLSHYGDKPHKHTFIWFLKTEQSKKDHLSSLPFLGNKWAYLDVFYNTRVGLKRPHNTSQTKRGTFKVIT